MVSRDRRDQIVLQKVRKQHYKEDNYKSLIPTFGKHIVLMTNKPKVRRD